MAVAAVTAAVMLTPTAALATVADEAEAQDGGAVTFIHGVPDFVADVYIDGELFVAACGTGEVTDQVALGPGSYDVAIYEEGTSPDDGDPVLEQAVEVTDGHDVAVVAHLDETGTPRLTVFKDEAAQIEAGQARITVRHTAEFGKADIIASGNALFTSVGVTEEGTADVPAGAYDVSLVNAMTGSEVVTVPGFQLEEGYATTVYAIGAPGQSFELLVQTEQGVHAVPVAVPAGIGGSATQASELPTVAGGLLLVGVGLFLSRRSARRARDG